MKKFLMGAAGLVLAVMLMSCASVPKQVAGKTIVAGRVVVGCKNYEGAYTVLNGDHTDGITVTVKNWYTGEEKNYSCDRNGYCHINNLSADQKYYVSHIRYVYTRSNGVTYIENDLNSDYWFAPEDSAILNLGVLYYCFDQKKGITWTTGQFEKVEKQYLRDLVEGTAWSNASVKRYNAANSWEEWYYPNEGWTNY